MQITVDALTIRQAKALGKTVGVKGFSKLNVKELIEAIKMKEPNATKLQAMVDDMLAGAEAKPSRAAKAEQQDPPSKYGDTKTMTKDELEAARLDALRDIARACGRRMRAEDELRSNRETLNQEVSESKANHKGAMERDVDYDNAESVREKLEAVTDAWQTWNDALEHRRQELEPLKEKLSKARAAERKAFEDSRQLKIRW